MNAYVIAFILINSVLLISLPRRFAPLPLVIGVCYMTFSYSIEVGPFNFTVIRILVAFGFLRAIMRRELNDFKLNEIDWLMVIWAVWAIISGLFHKETGSAIIFRLGLVYNTCGIYFLLRIFIKSNEEVISLLKILVFMLAPLAIEMIIEKVTGRNLFYILGGAPQFSVVREGKIRAQGPFAHSILAGTIGAVTLPLMVGLYRQYRMLSLIGILVCIVMVYASGSSGPVFAAMAGIGALFMWSFRMRMRLVRWMAVLGYIFLDLVMQAPAYYIIARVDAVGGSTGYHRAKLIESAIDHLSEWWIAGTDYTRDWMVTGVSWSPDHTDITNHYLQLGVWGGLPLMLLFIAILSKGFSFIGKAIHRLANEQVENKFILWAIGCSLFSYMAICISVSLFDQSFVFLYLTLAIIGSIESANRHVIAADNFNADEQQPAVSHS